MKKLALVCLAWFIALSGVITIGGHSVSANVNSMASSTADEFSWDNATVYFVMTDRFVDGDPSNNHSYGRELDQNGNPYPDYKSKVGTFHGGDLKGLTQKINEGYFNDLGVNSIWITAPYEQIHGWVGGESFRHYAYHGYYALDFTEVDRNMGTEEDFRTFVDTAHSNGIRVVMDIVLNHAGYETMKDMSEFNFGQLQNGWQNYYYNQPESAAHYNTYANYLETTDAGRWLNWWGADWIRVDKPGYSACGSSDQLMCLSGLPDFKTESTNSVGLPPLLLNKWSDAKRVQEQAELDAFFNRSGKPRTVANYLTKWLTDWVREYGVDGFRVDTAKHVDLSIWKGLKEEAVLALREWKSANPDKKLDDLDFWMTGEVWGHGVGRSNYFDNGFDSVINFSFQGSAGNLQALPSIHAEYASKINSDSSFNVLSYISSHDTSLFNRSNLINGGTSLLLLPGAVQIYYGDESARQPMAAPWDQPTRSDMNWNSIDQEVLSHWQRLGQFRNQHIAIGAGEHQQLQAAPYTFSRTYNKEGIQDKVVVVIGASGTTAVNVSSVYPDGTLVRDYYTGDEGIVQNGRVNVNAHPNGVILLEEVPTPEVKVSASPAGGGFSSDTLELTLNVQNADTGRYTVDGSDPAVAGITYTNGQKLTIGHGMEIGESVTLKLYGSNELGIDTRQYTYVKTERSVLTVHFKKPEAWGAPQLYYYETSPKLTEPTWATAPSMVSQGNGWYSYTIEDAERARVIFKDSNGNQLPAAQQAGLLVSEESWYDNGWVTDPTDHLAPTIPTNVRAITASSSTIQIAWDASQDNVAVAGYEVYREGSMIGKTSALFYSDSGLQPDTSYHYTVKAYDSAGNKSLESEPLKVSTTERSASNTATIYYKHGFNAPYFHYAPSGGSWTAVPGVAMTVSAEYPGYSVITVDLGTATSMQAVFNNGSGTWDNNGGRNYLFPAGISTFNNGVITSGEPNAVQEGLTIHLTVPGNTPANEPIYIASNISGWNPGDTSNQLTRNADGTYSITLPVESGTQLQFKFTRGTWSSVEVNAAGADISNRTYTMNGSSLYLTVQRWKDR